MKEVVNSGQQTVWWCKQAKVMTPAGGDECVRDAPYPAIASSICQSSPTNGMMLADLSGRCGPRISDFWQSDTWRKQNGVKFRKIQLVVSREKFGRSNHTMTSRLFVFGYFWICALWTQGFGDEPRLVVGSLPQPAKIRGAYATGTVHRQHRQHVMISPECKRFKALRK